MPGYHFITIGCQMNVSDSAFYAKVLENAGWEESSLDDADVVFINTCAVREASVHKMESWIGQLAAMRRRTGKPRIGVIGCVPAIDLAVFKKRHPQVDFVLGTYSGRQEMEVALIDAVECDLTENNPKPGDVTTYVPITYGCDSYCTYCIVPYTRGRLVSRPLHEIRDEIKALLDNGTYEVILLGQNVNAYGLDKGKTDGFAKLLEEVDNIDGLKRFRFLTSHPRDLQLETIDMMKGLSKMAPYFHLPVQAGSDEILRRMNRGYTVAQYKKLIDKINEVFPVRGLTTDLIVGFPGETDEQFNDSMRLLEDIRYDQVYSAQYSRRPKTPAASFVDQVDDKELNRRINIVVDRQRVIASENAKKNIGLIHEVLIEYCTDGVSTGMTGTGKFVRLEKALDPGTVVKIKITEAGDGPMTGECLESV
jgi:tRNA-2-methylthio-N6-dimethylallyladenosine synthase